MKYLPLVWAGIWRKRGRTALLLLQITIAFVLFGLLQGLNAGLNQAISQLDADVYFMFRATPGAPLPLAHWTRLQALPEITNLQRQSSLPATYQRPDQNVSVIATDVRTLIRDKTSMSVPAEALDAMDRTRDGAIASRRLAAKYGWKVGDRIPLQTHEPQQSGSTDWNFQLLGLYDDSDPFTGTGGMLLNWDYFNEARANQRNTVNTFVFRVRDVRQGPAVATRIDRMFQNSPDETRTQSRSELGQEGLQSAGDLSFVVRAIVGAVMFALLLSTGAMLMHSIRERTPELAVLRTLGFSDARVAGMLLIEACAICITGSAMGILVATRLIPLASGQIGVTFGMPLSVVLVGLGIGALLAILSASVPAWQSVRLSVAEGLSGR